LFYRKFKITAFVFNIINVFIVPFDQLNASSMNKSKMKPFKVGKG